MNRREFLRSAAVTSAATAALREGNLLAAEQANREVEKTTGLKHYIINVRDHGVKGDGVTDDSPAIQEMFERVNKELGNALTYFFPAGRYLISRQLRYAQHPKWGDKAGLNYIDQWIGQGPTLTQFVLKSHAPGYDDPEKPRFVFSMGGLDGECFGTIADGFAVLANEDGTNPGSVALVFQMHFGVSRNLVASGGHTCYLCEAWGAFAEVQNLTCLGGQYGLVVRTGGYAYHQVRCVGFTRAGVMMAGGYGTLTISNLFTRGAGPGVKVTENCVSVVGARCEADPAGQDAAVIDRPGSSTFVNLVTSGYAQMVQDDVPAAAGVTSALSFYSGRDFKMPQAGIGGGAR